ncbi:tetratricopeptide repeat protein [[Muricauda] lutisoli]|uniref:Tetratricopeptide repeat protein n=1 Tax=[Muricauda] lutisoli TaxID=2816035 RepID=A0ABS3ERQ7_9FLAO|nr:tetratricopeptide repeat protein [[Muricauda] lutisoli]MBO0328920.1 tetratricopeptide repeat protein [[Muricauda] lutisoli]
MKLKKGFLIVVVSIIAMGYVYLSYYSTPQLSMQSFIENTRDEFGKMAEDFNQKALLEQNRIEGFYDRVEVRIDWGMEYIDSLMINDKSLTGREKSHLNLIAGEALYDSGLINEALKRFENSEFTNVSPRLYADKAGCYAELGNFKKAEELLDKASNFNYDFKWHKGNVFEMSNELEKAKREYLGLYQRDTVVYRFCKERIDELESANPKLLESIDFRNRDNRIYIYLETAKENESPTSIGKIKFK